MSFEIEEEMIYALMKNDCANAHINTLMKNNYSILLIHYLLYHFVFD